MGTGIAQDNKKRRDFYVVATANFTLWNSKYTIHFPKSGAKIIQDIRRALVSGRIK